MPELHAKVHEARLVGTVRTRQGTLGCGEDAQAYVDRMREDRVVDEPGSLPEIALCAFVALCENKNERDAP
jgi:hypothetical protein